MFFNIHVGFESLKTARQPEEQKLIKLATAIAEIGMKEAIRYSREGVRELDVASKAEYAMRRVGAEAFPFPRLAS